MLTRILLIILLTLLFSSCTTKVPEEKPLPPETPQDPAQGAKDLENKGKYVDAAREYLHLAGTKPPPTRQGYQLSAIQCYLKAGQYKEAQTELEHLDVSQSFGLEIPLELIRTKIDLIGNKLESAGKRLKGIEPSTLPRPLFVQYRQLQIQLLALQDKLGESLREWMQLSRELGQGTVAAKENEQQFWLLMTSLSDSSLQTELKTQQDPIIKGWLELALLAKNVSPRYLSRAVNHWSARYANHPAAKTIVTQLGQYGQTGPSTPKQIALLLPMPNSRFEEQANAVREGFFAAAYTQQEAERPHITVHHVDVGNVLTAYEELVNAEVDFVVGPLEKDVLTTLAKSHPILPIPTLGLNYIDEPIDTGNLYQFGLRPEDEAKFVAIRGREDGHKSVLILVPQGDWGERVLKAFQKEWEQRGGKVAASLSYGDNFEKSAKKFFKNSPQADMVFMVVFPGFASKMRHLVLSTLGKDFPVYSTSHIYVGTPDAQRDAELEGVIFLDMPWVLKPNEQAHQLQTALQQYGAEGVAKLKRMYAFGADAYYLFSHLPLTNKQLGQTGTLFLNAEGKIHREQFLWARFVQGVPQLLENVPTPKKGVPQLSVHNPVDTLLENVLTSRKETPPLLDNNSSD